MPRTARIVIAAVIALAAAGALAGAILGGLNWGFALLLVSGGLLTVVKVWES
ncbi:hypothetical protein [Nonomuraea sp. NPDC050310]|uniref:hypothetical protein n=1 Tax=unclassified Nonomuraea TaxID=2593643 RepID=UPI00341119D6